MDCRVCCGDPESKRGSIERKYTAKKRSDRNGDALLTDIFREKDLHQENREICMNNSASQFNTPPKHKYLVGLESLR